MDHIAAGEPGAITTFYSCKGGAGCTLALAHAAVLLAERGDAGTPVLMVDWDLEAPGLHRYFPAGAGGPGLLELFGAYRDQLQRDQLPRDPVRRRARGAGAEEGDDEALARSVLAAVDWRPYVQRADQRRPLFLLRAGRPDAAYEARRAGLDWEALFHACPALFRQFGAMLAAQFGHVLIDAPHGGGDGAGICTALLPQRLALVFDANRHGLDGLESLVQRVTSYRLSHDGEPRGLLVYPVPARLDADDQVRRAQARHGDPAAGVSGYQGVCERALEQAYGVSQLSLDSYFNEVLVPQSRELARGGVLAGADGDRYAPVRAYQALLAWLEPGHPPWCTRDELPLLAHVAQARQAQDGGAARKVWLARALLELGAACRTGGRDAHAVPLWRESVALFAAAAGDGHPDTATARVQLADLLLQRQRPDEARLLLRQALDARSAALGPQHPGVLAVRSLQARALAAQGYLTAALARQQEVLDQQWRTLGAQHPAVLDSQEYLASLLCLAEDWEAARQWQEQVLAARTRRCGASHPATMRTADALAHTVAQMEAGSGSRHDGMAPAPAASLPDAGAVAAPGAEAQAVQQPLPAYGASHADNVYALRDPRAAAPEPLADTAAAAAGEGREDRAELS